MGGPSDWAPGTFSSNPSENERIWGNYEHMLDVRFHLGGVTLLEDEQRQLQEMEQALYRDDPKFGRLMRAGDPRVHYERKLIRALLGAVIGVGLLPTGAVTHRVYLEAVRGQGPARAFQGGDQDGDGRETPARAGQAGPDDGANGRALAPPSGG